VFRGFGPLLALAASFVLGVALVVAMLASSRRREQARVRRIHAQGTSATARLLDIVRVEGRRARRGTYRLTLELPLPGGPLVVVTHVVAAAHLVPQIDAGLVPDLAPGGSVPVHYSQASPQDLTVDLPDMEGPWGMPVDP
jgi:hypothetical protein